MKGEVINISSIQNDHKLPTNAHVHLFSCKVSLGPSVTIFNYIYQMLVVVTVPRISRVFCFADNEEIANFLLQNGAGFSSYTLMDHPAFCRLLLRQRVEETSNADCQQVSVTDAPLGREIEM